MVEPDYTLTLHFESDEDRDMFFGWWLDGGGEQQFGPNAGDPTSVDWDESNIWMQRIREDDDPEPDVDEAQEWHDYDPDC